MVIPPGRIRAFREEVFAFFRSRGRVLPWRETRDPYKILVSEVMLQQTQVDRVVPYYRRWLARWPTVQALAQAPPRAVLEAWSGLGYNRRALYLHQAAQAISQEFQGDVLRALREAKLPGVGPYTVRAVRIFAANEPIAAVDTNIRRILLHSFPGTPEQELDALAEACLPAGRSRDWHNALMDYGALALTSRKTGIRPLSRQAPFPGSERQLRGRLLKLLLQGARSPVRLAKELEEPRARVGRVLDRLVEEGLLAREGGKVRVA